MAATAADAQRELNASNGQADAWPFYFVALLLRINPRKERSQMSVESAQQSSRCTIRELKQFLSTFEDEAFIGIDGFGMSLVVYDNKTLEAELQAANLGKPHDLDYFVIGGLEE